MGTICPHFFCLKVGTSPLFCERSPLLQKSVDHIFWLNKWGLFLKKVGTKSGDFFNRIKKLISHTTFHIQTLEGSKSGSYSAEGRFRRKAAVGGVATDYPYPVLNTLLSHPDQHVPDIERAQRAASFGYLSSPEYPSLPPSRLRA